MTNNPRDHAGVIFPPPLIYLGGLLLGAVIHQLWPISLLPSNIAWALGLALCVACLVLAGAAIRLMRGAGTNVRPDKPASMLITAGPFRYTRNPIYLAMTLIYIGASLLINTLWPLALLPIVLIVMTYGVIQREEAYLTRRFGATYTTYTSQVRRWL